MKFIATANWGSSQWGDLRNHVECASELSLQRRGGWAVHPFRELTSPHFWTPGGSGKSLMTVKRGAAAPEVGHRQLSQGLSTTDAAEVRGGPRTCVLRRVTNSSQDATTFPILALGISHPGKPLKVQRKLECLASLVMEEPIVFANGMRPSAVL